MKVSMIAAVIALSVGASFRASADTTYNLEDLDFSWMSSGWSTPCKNATIYNRSSPLRLWDGSAWTEYNRGISTQAPSHWCINLGGDGASFSATVGLDKSSFGDGDTADSERCGDKVVKFAVIDVVGGTNLTESAWLGTQTAAQTIYADLSGVELIDLVVYADPQNGGGWQHCDWVNPTIVMKGESAPATRTADGTNHWIGKGADDFWATPANWEFGVPGADATVVFDSDAIVLLDGDKTVSNLVVNAGAIVKFMTTNFWGTDPNLVVQEAGGEGTIQLYQAGIMANYDNRNTVAIDTAVVEILNAYENWNLHDNWLDGLANEGQKMVVNSKVLLNGYLKAYRNVEIAGDMIWGADGMLHLDAAATAKKVVYKGALSFSSDHAGTIERVVVAAGSYALAENTGVSAELVLDGGTIDVGDGSAIDAGGLEIGVLSGGYLRYTVSEFPAEGAPAFPANVTFPADADLTKVVAIVKNTAGDAQKAYTISKSGDVYSLTELAAASEAKWVGGIDDNWQTAGNWLSGAVPVEGQAVVFERTADVWINQDVTLPKISTLSVESGAKVSLRYKYAGSAGNYWTDGGGAPVISFDKITGEGALALQHVGLVGGEGASIGCAELEIMPFMSNDEWRDTYINGPESGTPVSICANITGSGWLNMRNRLAFSGDNSAYAGGVKFHSVGADGRSDRYFNSNTSFFPNASKFEFYGKAFIGFTEGTARLGNVTIGESWGASFVVKYGAQVTLEVESGSIRDTYFGNGFEVRTCAQDSEGYDNSTAGCANLTIKKVGEGTLVYGVTKQHNLVVAEGRVEFTGENDNGDDADVNVTVKNGASIGSAASMTSGNGTAIGGDVTVRHQFTFEPGAAIKQEYIATTTTDEQTQEETTTYSMRKLTIANDVNLANVVFGVTNPEDLPAVSKATLADLPRFTMFAANSLSGAVATENGGYAPEGSVKHGAWIARLSRSTDNEVEFRPYVMSGFSVNIR